MDFRDSRSFRMVVMADYFMNPQQYKRLPPSQQVYDYLRDSGYGIIKMPPLGTPKRAVPAWISSTVDQIQEYGNRGFTVLLLGMNSIPGKGIWLTELKKELTKRGTEVPPLKTLSTTDLKSPDSTKKCLTGFLS